jgi:hypothetical protein
MSDELRSAPGHRPEQRRNGGAPAWWSELDRSDLPSDDESGPAPARRAAAARPPARGRSEPWRPGPGRSARLRNAAITALVVLVAALVCWIGVGGGSIRSVVVVLLVFGVPALLAAATASVILRRTR